MTPDKSTRLRLVELRTQGATLHLGGGLASILAEPEARSAAARWIASTVAGPRPAGADATIEIAGRFVSASGLPSPLLSPSAHAVLGREVLAAHWRAAWGRRRDELAAQHASLRLSSHRTDAALERARTRRDDVTTRIVALAASAEPTEPVAAPPTEPPPAPEAAVDNAIDRDGRLAARQRIAGLLAGLAECSPVPQPLARELADEWEVHLAAVAAVPRSSRVSVTEAEARRNGARIAVALASGGVDATSRGELDERHRDVLVAEAALGKAKRKERPAALARYDAAVRLEQHALEAAGAESYASFLMTLAQGARVSDAQTRRAAEENLERAQEVLDQARQAAALPNVAERAQRELELRARAAEILGRFPGEDVAGQLCAHRVENADAAAMRADLRRELTSAGVAAEGDDLVSVAHAYLEEPQPVPASAPPLPIVASPPPAETSAPTSGEIVMLQDEQITLDGELGLLQREQDENERILAGFDAELARLDAVRNADVEALEPPELTLALEDLMNAYRRGDLLAGRLPIVLDGALDGLTAASRNAAATTLAAADDVQAIVVTDDHLLADAIAVAGGAVISWHELNAGAPVVGPAAESRGLAEVAAAPDSSREECALHPASVSIERCGHCTRPCCVDCLVYVLGETELWCTACAVAIPALGANRRRLARKRGA